jgi:cytochrome P450 family 110
MSMASTRVSLPPGPETPPAQQARQWIERPLDLLDACSRQFGDAFTLQLGNLGATVMFSRPESVKTIFRAPSHLFECRQFNESYRFVMGDNALFLQDGERHRQIKRVMTPPLCLEGMENHAREIRESAGSMLEGWSVNRSQAVRPLMHELGLRVVVKMIFGMREEAAQLVVNWFKTDVWRDQRAWKPWANLSRLQPRLRALISDELEFRRVSRESGRRPDLLDYFLAARYEDGQPMTEVEIQDQILTLTITAVDPVAFALTWLLAWVARSPAVQSTLRDEVVSLGNDPDLPALLQLPYLTAACQEVLRIHPILPTVEGRRLTAPLEIQGYHLEAGINVAPCAYLVHRREDLYPEPLAFRPERFLSRQYSPHEYFPFGGGNRRCLGTTLAPMEMKLVLAMVLSRGRIVLENAGGADVRYGTMVAPDESLRIGLEPL